MIDDEQLNTVARLARLRVEPQEAPALAADMAAILDLVDLIRQADTAAVAPLSNPHERLAPLRPDAVTEHDQRERFQALAPAVEDGLYLVPRVVE